MAYFSKVLHRRSNESSKCDCHVLLHGLFSWWPLQRSRFQWSIPWGTRNCNADSCFLLFYAVRHFHKNYDRTFIDYLLNFLTWKKCVIQLNLFSFSRQGTGGGTQEYRNLCVLPPNMLNQKFFSIWFVWLTALIIISAIMVVLRIAIVFSSEIRELMLNMVYQIRIKNVSERFFTIEWLKFVQIYYMTTNSCILFLFF